MAEPTAVRTDGEGEHVVLCRHGWFGSATGWGWLPGEQDPALSADVMRATWLARHPDAELEVLADAGHRAPEEAPEETPVALVTSVEEFLARRG